MLRKISPVNLCGQTLRDGSDTTEATFMSRRLVFNHDFRRRQAAYGLSLKDEADWLKNDAAARWLQRNENRASRKADRCASEPQPVSQVQASPRKSRKRRLADLDPCDPHDQLAGVDMKQLPWR